MEPIRQIEANLQAARADMSAMLTKATAERRGLTDEERIKSNALTATVDKLEADLKAAHRAAAFDRSDAAPLAGYLPTAPADDDDYGGGSFVAETPVFGLPAVPRSTRARLAALGGKASSAPAGEKRAHFAAVVRAAYGGDPFDPLLRPLAAAGNESVPSEGGFAVRPDMAADIFVRAAEESIWMRIGCRVELMASEERTISALADDDESSDAAAALTAAWTSEGATATAQAMKMRQLTLHARKLMVLAACSNELDGDAPNYLPGLEAALSQAIAKKLDRSIISGTGAGQPLGLLSAPATVTVAKTVNGDPGTTGTFTWNHATGMWARLAPGSHERAWWLVHPSVFPQLLTMHAKIKNVAGTENVGGFVPAAVFQAGGPTGYMLLGRPVLVTGRVKPLSSLGDVVLVDPTAVAVGIRAGITIDRSPHVYFASDQLAIRGKFRGDAGPLWDKARTLQEGTDTVSPYVVLAAR